MFDLVWSGESKIDTLESENPDMSTWPTIRLKTPKHLKLQLGPKLLIHDSFISYIYSKFSHTKKYKILDLSLNFEPVTNVIGAMFKKINSSKDKEKIYQANINQKNVRISILKSDKTDCNAKKALLAIKKSAI